MLIHPNQLKIWSSSSLSSSSASSSTSLSLSLPLWSLSWCHSCIQPKPNHPPTRCKPLQSCDQTHHHWSHHHLFSSKKSESDELLNLLIFSSKKVRVMKKWEWWNRSRPSPLLFSSPSWNLHIQGNLSFATRWWRGWGGWSQNGAAIKTPCLAKHNSSKTYSLGHTLMEGMRWVEPKWSCYQNSLSY